MDQGDLRRRQQPRQLLRQGRPRGRLADVGPRAASVTADYWKTVDTVLMGRKTYEVALRQAKGEGFPGVKTYVFSRTLKELPTAGSTSSRRTRSGSSGI